MNYSFRSNTIDILKQSIYLHHNNFLRTKISHYDQYYCTYYNNLLPINNNALWKFNIRDSNFIALVY